MSNYYYLAETIRSHVHQKVIYGNEGEKVREISRSGHVLAVEGEKECFSVPLSKLIPIENIEQ